MRSSQAVVDASYVLDLLFPDENKSKLENVRMSAPKILAFEVANAIKMAVVRKRINIESARALIREYESWGVEAREIEMGEVWETAMKDNLSVYDASYVWLAKKLHCPLLTWDKKLAKLV